MKKTVLVIGALLLALGFIYADLMVPSSILEDVADNASKTVRETSNRSVPDYSFNVNPLNIMASWYDYFPGAYESIPIRVQPAPAGIWDGGGVYIAFQATPAAGGIRRVYYVYIEDGTITSGPSLIDLTGSNAEGFPGIDVDPVTGDPFVSWHTINPSNPAWYMCPLTFDQYNLIGTPGLWNTPYGVLLNPYTVDGIEDQEFIWPSVFVGPSPTAGLRRVYIVGKNFSSNVHGNPCENSMIAFADFADPTDLSSYDADQWTYITIPQLDQWRQDNVRPFRATIVSRNSGHVAIVGHTADLSDTSEPFGPNDVMFVLENLNYGEGEWTVVTGDPTIPVDNPDGYFEAESGQPYQDLRYGPYVNRHNTVIDEQGNYHFVAFFSLSTEENTWYPYFSTTKHVKFNAATQDYTINDLYPRSEDGSPYLPWSIPPVYEEGFLVTNASYPSYWWDTEDLFHENYHRIIQDGPRMVALFQESIKARFFHDAGDETYAAWASVPETYIMISGDYGDTWSDPIILNSIETPELAGLIPTYWYISDHMEDLGSNWYRMHMFLYSQNDYGSFLQGNGPNSGGNVMYTSIDVDFSTVTSTDDEVVVFTPNQMLRQNYPNPFNPSTTISYNIPSSMEVSLEIYNVKGQLVRTLESGVRPAGEHYVVWNGTDNSDRAVGSGVYFYKLSTESHNELKKMLLVK